MLRFASTHRNWQGWEGIGGRRERDGAEALASGRVNWYHGNQGGPRVDPTKNGPWSMPYNIVTEKIQAKIVFSSIKEGNLEINNLEQLPEYFLDKLFPSGNLESETTHHKELRKQIEKPHTGVTNF
ncbi:hypothetical protein J437_LFUL017454 [Ladona fulva]|uniref:Uncharacterized protein n=1 Tax=Ladona fulva TaxID=123851 RepID=A0A8K0KN73_LADFU|nr:hypothetical protein J437_LFUL017454 [Ladona fulva]